MDGFEDALNAAQATGDPASLEARVTALEGMVRMLLATGGVRPAPDPDAVPGEQVISERDIRYAKGDGGAVMALAVPLPKPYGFLRVRVVPDSDGAAMKVIWRHPRTGEQHEATFPL